MHVASNFYNYFVVSTYTVQSQLCPLMTLNEKLDNNVIHGGINLVNFMNLNNSYKILAHLNS